jgi:hypothetical protein
MDGVKSDRVRCELASAARRIMFFWQNSDGGASDGHAADVAAAADDDEVDDSGSNESSPKSEVCAGCCTGLASGLIGFCSERASSAPGPAAAAMPSSGPIAAIWSGTHSRSERRWMMAGSSSMSR